MDTGDSSTRFSRPSESPRKARNAAPRAVPWAAPTAKGLPLNRTTGSTSVGPTRMAGEGLGHVPQGTHAGQVLLGEVGQADAGVVAQRHQEQHLVERGEPIVVDHVAVRVDVVGPDVVQQPDEVVACRAFYVNVHGTPPWYSKSATGTHRESAGAVA